MTETLITSSVLILGICLLRLMLRGKINPCIQYGMWGAVALRLVIPWFDPVSGWLRANLLKNLGISQGSPFSVMNAAGRLGEMVSERHGMGLFADNLTAGQAARYPDPVIAAGQWDHRSSRLPCQRLGYALFYGIFG